MTVFTKQSEREIEKSKIGTEREGGGGKEREREKGLETMKWEGIIAGIVHNIYNTSTAH